MAGAADSRIASTTTTRCKTLLPLFRPQNAGGYAEIPTDTDLSLLPDVPCQNATALLSPAGVEYPRRFDAPLLDVFFSTFFEVGFLAKPLSVRTFRKA